MPRVEGGKQFPGVPQHEFLDNLVVSNRRKEARAAASGMLLGGLKGIDNLLSGVRSARTSAAEWREGTWVRGLASLSRNCRIGVSPQEAEHQGSDFMKVRLEEEVATVQEFDLGSC